ncbi:uncharacterized, partial [Tachysurus ichikawai]
GEGSEDDGGQEDVVSGRFDGIWGNLTGESVGLAVVGSRD